MVVRLVAHHLRHVSDRPLSRASLDFFLEYQSVFSEQRIADTVAPLAWGYCHFPYAALTSLNVARYSFPSDFNINVLSYDRLLTTIKILTKGLHLRSVSTCNDF